MIYTLIDYLFYLGSVVMFIYGLYDTRNVPFLWLYGILSFIFYPILIELILNLYSVITASSVKSDFDSNVKKMQAKPYIGLIYSKKYNIKACGLEKCHPFDSTKYERVNSQIISDSPDIFNPRFMWAPNQPSRALLALAISRFHLFKLCYSIYSSKIVELPICFLPGPVIRNLLLNPMLRATKGTVDGCIIALMLGYCINLSGGYHHASQKSGGGFCVYADITLAVRYLRKFTKVKKVMIVDLDAHQGNGHERDHIGDKDTFIIDAYNPQIYPGDSFAKQGIASNIHAYSSTNDKVYLESVGGALQSAISQFKPDFLIYNAGTDCMIGDPLGNMSISPKGIIERDELVFEECLKNKVPVLMVLSGGYQKTNAPVIAKSLENLWNGKLKSHFEDRSTLGKDIQQYVNIK